MFVCSFVTRCWISLIYVMRSCSCCGRPLGCAVTWPSARWHCQLVAMETVVHDTLATVLNGHDSAEHSVRQTDRERWRDAGGLTQRWRTGRGWDSSGNMEQAHRTGNIHRVHEMLHVPALCCVRMVITVNTRWRISNINLYVQCQRFHVPVSSSLIDNYSAKIQ